MTIYKVHPNQLRKFYTIDGVLDSETIRQNIKLLKDCVGHWNRLQHYTFGVTKDRPNTEHCALCRAYYYRSGQRCTACPIAYVANEFCRNTPLSAVLDVFNNLPERALVGLPLSEKAIRRNSAVEYKFLQSLLSAHYALLHKPMTEKDKQIEFVARKYPEFHKLVMSISTKLGFSFREVQKIRGNLRGIALSAESSFLLCFIDSSSLLNAFIWASSPQGIIYWEKIYNKLCQQEEY